MRRCAVELTGRNSVSPSIMPSTVESRKSFKVPPVSEYRRKLRVSDYVKRFGEFCDNLQGK
jgi:hypothetical protein